MITEKLKHGQEYHTNDIVMYEDETGHVKFARVEFFAMSPYVSEQFRRYYVTHPQLRWTDYIVPSQIIKLVWRPTHD